MRKYVSFAVATLMLGVFAVGCASVANTGTVFGKEIALARTSEPETTLVTTTASSTPITDDLEGKANDDGTYTYVVHGRTIVINVNINDYIVQEKNAEHLDVSALYYHYQSFVYANATAIDYIFKSLDFALRTAHSVNRSLVILACYEAERIVVTA